MMGWGGKFSLMRELNWERLLSSVRMACQSIIPLDSSEWSLYLMEVRQNLSMIAEWSLGTPILLTLQSLTFLTPFELIDIESSIKGECGVVNFETWVVYES